MTLAAAADSRAASSLLMDHELLNKDSPKNFTATYIPSQATAREAVSRTKTVCQTTQNKMVRWLTNQMVTWDLWIQFLALQLHQSSVNPLMLKHIHIRTL